MPLPMVSPLSGMPAWACWSFTWWREGVRGRRFELGLDTDAAAALACPTDAGRSRRTQPRVSSESRLPTIQLVSVYRTTSRRSRSHPAMLRAGGPWQSRHRAWWPRRTARRCRLSIQRSPRGSRFCAGRAGGQQVRHPPAFRSASRQVQTSRHSAPATGQPASRRSAGALRRAQPRRRSGPAGSISRDSHAVPVSNARGVALATGFAQGMVSRQHWRKRGFALHNHWRTIAEPRRLNAADSAAGGGFLAAIRLVVLVSAVGLNSVMSRMYCAK